MPKSLKGRKVKHQDTGEYGNSLTSYKAPNGKYYSSESAYKTIKEDNEYWLKSMNALMEILGYEQGMKLPSAAAKKFSEYRGYGMKNVYDVIMQCKENRTFDWIARKEFSSEWGRVSYYSTVIVNKVAEQYKNPKPFTPANAEVPSFEDDEEVKHVNKKRHDVSAFIKDEDDLW